ncbi:MAG TPA: twin transmembrane helix small protein [Parvularculaceae bacterium]|nr:twin transmembrane helix small protein [Parvularculaceae bacterium]HNS87431.1 twin transmembrane helix small protein [Parvularculaceae bacterium]
MDKLVYFLIPVGLGATLIILGLGIYSLAKGGAFAKANSNRLMRLRVLAQGVTIALMLLFLFLIGRGPGA